MLKKIIKFLNLVEESQLVKNIPSPEEKIYSLFNADFYQDENIRKLESWLFYNYFNQSDSLIEKKYKIAILGLVFEHKNIYISKMPLIDDIVKDTSKELIQNKETSVDLYEIFPHINEFDYIWLILSKNLPQKITGLGLIPKILDEDKNDFEKMNVLKKSYEQFSCLGLLAESFINSKSNTELLINFQDSKFTTNDIKIFKEFINKVTNPSYNGYHSVKLKLSYWEKLVSNEYSSDNLNIFKQIYLNDEGEPSDSFFGGLYNLHHKDTRKEDKAYLIQLVEKRIEYLELDNYLGEQPKIQINKTKRPKL
jgi:hypothetical protein